MMYCKNCKKEKKLGDKYCDECGEKLTISIMPMKITKKTIGILVAIVVGFLLLLGGYQYVSFLTSPKTIAMKYFNTIIKNDTKKVYSYLEGEKTEFSSLQMLEEKMEKINADDYEVISVQQGNKKAVVTIEYTDYNQKKYVQILLNREKNSLFNKWKVDSGQMVKNIELKIMKGSTITIDNKDISKYKVEKEDDYFDIYRIPTMIKGEYQINATLPNNLTVDKKFEVSSDQTYFISTVTLENTVKNNLQKQMTTMLNRLYSSALQKKSYSSIQKDITVSLEDVYDRLKERLTNSNVKSIQFSDSSIKDSYMNEENCLEVVATIDYQAKVEENKKTETIYHQEVYVFEFDYVNSKFVIKNIDRRRW